MTYLLESVLRDSFVDFLKSITVGIKVGLSEIAAYHIHCNKAQNINVAFLTQRSFHIKIWLFNYYFF